MEYWVNYKRIGKYSPTLEVDTWEWIDEEVEYSQGPFDTWHDAEMLMHELIAQDNGAFDFSISIGEDGQETSL